MSRPERHVRNTPFSFTVAQKIILNDSLVFKLFVFFLVTLKIYSQRNYVWDYLFFIDIWTDRALSGKATFLHVTSGTAWSCFLTCNYLLQIITCIRHIKFLSLSFITYTFVGSSLPVIWKINFLSFKCHIRNFWNAPYIQVWSPFNVLSHIMQRSLAAEIE